jgi:hypothetical protein
MGRDAAPYLLHGEVHALGHHQLVAVLLGHNPAQLLHGVQGAIGVHNVLCDLLVGQLDLAELFVLRGDCTIVQQLPNDLQRFCALDGLESGLRSCTCTCI